MEKTMNWDAISAIAEVLGAVVVVASLIYVGRQVGQNTAMMRVTAASETLERDYDLVLPLIESQEFTEIWLKGDNRLNDLSETDRQRLLFFERRAISLWHHNFQLRMQGLYPDANWHNQNWMIQTIGHRQAIREAWSVFKNSHETSFQEYVDKQFKIADDASKER
jgi:hypothetical protein